MWRRWWNRSWNPWRQSLTVNLPCIYRTRDNWRNGNVPMNRTEIFNYLLKEYFKNSIDQVVRTTGYERWRIDQWRSGTTQPRKVTIDYVIRCAVSPEFQIIVEFESFVYSPETDNLRDVLRELLGENCDVPGIYSFYDSMGNLIYVGKTRRSLLGEIQQALGRRISVAFPRGIKEIPERRYDVVRYISAYHVGETSFIDYPEHVESLILRIAKPLLNQRIGTLARYEPTQEEH